MTGLSCQTGQIPRAKLVKFPVPNWSCPSWEVLRPQWPRGDWGGCLVPPWECRVRVHPVEAHGLMTYGGGGMGGLPDELSGGHVGGGVLYIFESVTSPAGGEKEGRGVCPGGGPDTLGGGRVSSRQLALAREEAQHTSYVQGKAQTCKQTFAGTFAIL